MDSRSAPQMRVQVQDVVKKLRLPASEEITGTSAVG